MCNLQISNFAIPAFMPKILIIRFSSIGDIVLTTPVIRHLKQQIPNAEVHYCTRENYQQLITSNPYIDKVFVLKNSLWELGKELRAEKYDYVIDLHHNLRTLRLKMLIGNKPKMASFNKLNYEKFIYVNLKKDIMPKVHIVDRYLDTIAAVNLAITPDNEGLDYFIPRKDELNLAEILPPSHQNNYIAYAIGAQHNTKKLPPNKIIELCDKINQPIVLLGDKNDAIIAEDIAAYFEQLPHTATKIFNACGKFNLNQSAYLLQQSKLVFAHDTGLMHIAAALKKTVYSIWGNTTPSLGMYPYKTKFFILENKQVNCRPCSKIGFDQCPKKHFDCMNKIDFSVIENL